MRDAIVKKNGGQKESGYGKKQEERYCENYYSKQAVEKVQKCIYRNDDRTYIGKNFAPLSQCGCDNKMSNNNLEKPQVFNLLEEVKTGFSVFILFAGYLVSGVLFGIGQSWLLSILFAFFALLPTLTFSLINFTGDIMEGIIIGVLLTGMWVGVVLAGILSSNFYGL